MLEAALNRANMARLPLQLYKHVNGSYTATIGLKYQYTWGYKARSNDPSTAINVAIALYYGVSNETTH